MKTVYHGTPYPAWPISLHQPMSFASDVKDAEAFAGPNGYVYALDIDESSAVEINDFDTFDCMKITGKFSDLPELTSNRESGWYIVKHPEYLRRI